MSYKNTSGQPELLENIVEPTSRDAINDHERYSRQVLFAPIGEPGQQRLASGHVAIVGVGATGAATASLLARAGVGRLTLIDRDFVEPSNLQRQILFDEDDARECLPKAEAARRHLARFNSAIPVHAHIADLTPRTAERSSETPTSFSTAPTTSRPATSSTTSASATAAPGSTPPPSAPTPPP